ncbi:MAG: polysialyltransferase family glycosyltransferase [Candidatus Odinarchaeia archaeon]
MTYYRVLFVAGCPNSIQISKKVAKELVKIAGNKLKCEIINTYKLEPDKTFKNIRSKWKFIGDTRVITAKKILDEKKPDIVIVGDDGGINAFIVKIAQFRRIPVLAIQVGMLSDEVQKGIKSIFRWRWYLLWRLYSKITENRLIAKILIAIRWRVRFLEWGLGGADILAVMGNYYKELMIKRGVPPHKIAVCGYVLLDDTVKAAFSKSVKTLENILGLNPAKKKLLLLSQPLIEDNICTYNKYFNILELLLKNLNEDYQLIIKPHPREDIGKYNKLIKKFSEKLVVTNPEYELGDLVNYSEYVVTFQSTAGLTAFVYKKPLVILDLIKFPYVNPLKSFSIAVNNTKKLKEFAQNPKEFVKNFKTDYMKGVREHLYKLDGKSSLRIARLILKILHTKKH